MSESDAHGLGAGAAVLHFAVLIESCAGSQSRLIDIRNEYGRPIGYIAADLRPKTKIGEPSVVLEVSVFLTRDDVVPEDGIVVLRSVGSMPVATSSAPLFVFVEGEETRFDDFTYRLEGMRAELSRSVWTGSLEVNLLGENAYAGAIPLALLEKMATARDVRLEAGRARLWLTNDNKRAVQALLHAIKSAPLHERQ